MRTRLSMEIHATLLAGMLMAGPAAADTFVVTRGDDPAPDGCLAGDCSLREALAAAETTPSADVIELGAGLYNVTLGELPVVGEIALEGVGSASTSIVGAGDFDLLHLLPLGRMTLEGVQLSVQPDHVAVRGDRSELLLRDVHVPLHGGLVIADSSDGGTASMRIEHSTIGDIVGCDGLAGQCVIVDSTLNGFVALSGFTVVLDHVEVDGPPSFYGVTIATTGAATIVDSTIRNQDTPLWVGTTTPGATEDVHVRRTRFIGNSGPMRGTRDGGVYMEDVEFRDNVVGDDFVELPSVLIAENGPGWRITRALFSGNRGGGGINPNLDGATVRALAGANLVISNATFEDNTFRSDIDGFGDTVGVAVTSNLPTIAWLAHSTMLRSPFVPASTPGSLLTVRGASANVRVFNSVLSGSCALVSGGAMFQAAGNIESPADTCEFPSADNSVDVPADVLLLGTLGDHGGFTETFEPEADSVLVDAAVPVWCFLAAGLDQRGYVRPAQGIGCDIGAVETASFADSIFRDGFE